MVREVVEEVRKYFQTCEHCNKEFQLPYKGSEDKLCSRCWETKRAVELKIEMKFLFGATIVDFEPYDTCSKDKLERLVVRTSDGKEVILKLEGWEEKYIEVELIDPEEG